MNIYVWFSYFLQKKYIKGKKGKLVEKQWFFKKFNFFIKFQILSSF